MKVIIVFHLLVSCSLLYNTCKACNETDFLPNKNVRYPTKNEFRYVASIGLKNYGHDPDIPVHVCSGVLITTKHVITLAHCMNEVKKISDVRVRLGFNDLKFTEKYRIKFWTTYELWAKDNNMIAGQLEHDVAILKLDRKVESAKPATVTTIDNANFFGKKVVTVFWSPKSCVRTARFLKSAVLDVISDVECQTELKNSPLMIKNHAVDETYLCSNLNLGAVLEDVDSGSPVLISGNQLIGINDPTYLQRKGIYAPINVNFHIGLASYQTFIQNVTETKSAKWWQWNRN